MKKAGWTEEEDNKLMELVSTYGAQNWTSIAAGVEGRNSKSCRLRWWNQLNPNVKKDPFTQEEDLTILAARANPENSWVDIARALPGRTDNQIKNRYNSALKRKFGEDFLQNSSAVEAYVQSARAQGVQFLEVVPRHVSDSMQMMYGINPGATPNDPSAAHMPPSRPLSGGIQFAPTQLVARPCDQQSYPMLSNQ